VRGIHSWLSRILVRPNKFLLSIGSREIEPNFNTRWKIAVLCSTECLRLSLNKFIFYCSSNLIFGNNAKIFKYQTGYLIFNNSQPIGHNMYRQFNVNQHYVLPTQCVYVFCVDLRTNSDYFTAQHWLVGFCNWDGVCLLCGTFYILRSAHTVYLCVLCGSENKQRLFHWTALTGWFL